MFRLTNSRPVTENTKENKTCLLNVTDISTNHEPPVLNHSERKCSLLCTLIRTTGDKFWAKVTRTLFCRAFADVKMKDLKGSDTEATRRNLVSVVRCSVPEQATTR
jgi:hypothetical protein